MANNIHVEIITPANVVLSDDFSMVVVRALDGEIGILSNHAPLISTLTEWPVRLAKEDKSEIFVSVGGGFLEVIDNTVTILSSAAEIGEDIDIERALKSKSRAEERIKKHSANKNQDKIDYARAEASLRRALSRLKTAEMVGRKI